MLHLNNITHTYLLIHLYTTVYKCKSKHVCVILFKLLFNTVTWMCYLRAVKAKKDVVIRFVKKLNQVKTFDKFNFTS